MPFRSACIRKLAGSPDHLIRLDEVRWPCTFISQDSVNAMMSAVERAWTPGGALHAGITAAGPLPWAPTTAGAAKDGGEATARTTHTTAERAATHN